MSLPFPEKTPSLWVPSPLMVSCSPSRGRLPRRTTSWREPWRFCAGSCRPASFTKGTVTHQTHQTQRTYLVGGIPTPLKNMSSSVGITIPNISWKIKFMFQTTNQIWKKYGNHVEKHPWLTHVFWTTYNKKPQTSLGFTEIHARKKLGTKHFPLV